MTDLIIPFVRREEQVNILRQAINSYYGKSKSIVIRGESGSGKTELLRHAIKQYVTDSEYTTIYINLNSDLLSCSVFFDELLFTVWNTVEPNEQAMLSISKKQSFRSYISKSFWNKKLAKQLYQIVVNSIAGIPKYGPLISSAIKVIDPNSKFSDNTIDRLDYIKKYLKYVCKAKKVILAIDNYQFIPSNIKIMFESSLQEITQNLFFISVYRENKTNIILPLCFSNDNTEVKINKFDYNDTYYLLETIYSKSNLQLKEISNDCYGKTSGNLKEIDIYLKENHKYIINGVITTNKSRSLKQIIAQMPEIQKYLVLLSAIFPAGLKIEYVMKIINNIMFIKNENLLMDELHKLITLGYLVINSAHHNLMKPSHEKITLSLSEIQSEENFLEFYNNIRVTLENLIETKAQSQDYIYILHCIVGLYNTNQLIENMKYLIDLINIEYSCCAFYYIASVYKHIQVVAVNLPETCINKILDSCQKTSEFSLGLSFMERLKRQNCTLYDKFKLYEIKFLTQLYDFETALEEANTMGNSNEILLYKLNILQHLGRNAEALQHVTEVFKLTNKDKWNHLIMRNSAHYFSYEDAFHNLTQSLDFFKQYGTKFDQATILNNIGVINVWNGSYEEAEKYLFHSLKIHQAINSNEIFEVYCNLSVMEFLRDNIKGALEYSEKAIASVPQSLVLDHIILKANSLLFKFALETITIKAVYEELLLLYNNPIKDKDPWVKFQIIYNLSSFEKFMGLNITEQPSEYYLNKNEKLQQTCFEVLTKLKIKDDLIPVSLSLSPNWRY